MTQTDINTLIADLNLAALRPHEGTPAFQRCAAAIARIKAGTKLREVPRHSVVYLLEDRVMIQLTWDAHRGCYVASQYDEHVE